MEIKYKKRTYEIRSYKNCFGTGYSTEASWFGYSAIGNTKEEAMERCHQMIAKDDQDEE